MHQVRIGNVEVVAVLDTSVEPPATALFPKISDEQWGPYAEHMCPDGKTLPLSISSFVVRSGGKTILVDTGIGAKDRSLLPNGRLPDALAEVGVKPGDVDIVLTTHIHIDHVGWHTTKRGDSLQLTFPRATCVFNRAEYEYWTAPDVANAPGNEHVVDCVLPLAGLGADVELVDGEHKVTDEIVLLPTPGHTPAHVSVGIVSAGESGVIIGDVCHHPAQVTELWSPVFDMNPALATASREKLMEKLERERSMVIAGHFAHPGFGRVVMVDGKRYWRGL